MAPKRLPAAAGLSKFVRITAGAMGTLIAPTLGESRAVLHHAHLVERLQQGDPALTAALGGLTGAGLSEPAALAQATRMIEQQAYTCAADDIFLASARMCLLLIGLIWLTTRPPRVASAGAAALRRFSRGTHTDPDWGRPYGRPAGPGSIRRYSAPCLIKMTTAVPSLYRNPLPAVPPALALACPQRLHCPPGPAPAVGGLCRGGCYVG